MSAKRASVPRAKAAPKAPRPKAAPKAAPKRRTPAARTRSVVIVASEAVPFAKSGGLADVMGALPPALARLGWDVTLVLPRYRGAGDGAVVERVPIAIGGITQTVTFLDATAAEGVRAILVD